MTDEQNDEGISELTNDFLNRVRNSDLFDHLALPLKAELSKKWVENASKTGEKLETDCCRNCGIKITPSTTKIRVKVKKRKGKR